MEINPTLTAEEFEAINDDDVKALYKPKDDAFILDVKGVLGAKDATKRKYEAEKAERERLENELRTLEPFRGLEFEKVDKAIQTATKLEEKRLIDKGEFEKIRLRDREEMEKLVSAKDQEIEQWKSNYTKTVIKNEVQSALVQQGVKTEGNALEFATDAFLKTVNFDPIKQKIVDENGYDTGKTLADAAAEFKNKHGLFFQSSNAGGTPATPNGARNGLGANKWSDLGVREKSQAIGKYGSIDEAKKHYS